MAPLKLIYVINLPMSLFISKRAESLILGHKHRDYTKRTRKGQYSVTYGGNLLLPFTEQAQYTLTVFVWPGGCFHNYVGFLGVS